MKIAVLVKQIPDPSGVGKLDPHTHLLARDQGEVVLDPGDSYGVEAALQVAAATQGEVVVISMGPAKAVEVIRKAMAMGASEGVLITDERLRGSDALTTARVLAAATKKVQPDLLIACTESTDGYTGTVPSSIAELLGWPSLTFAKQLEVSGDKVRIHRQTPNGHDVVEAELPAVVTVTGGINEPRYPTLKGIVASRSRPLDQPTLEELGIDPSAVGQAGAGQRIVSVEPAPQRAGGEVVEDQGQAAKRIADYLAELKVI
ncbi:MAG TPA: electron transfer flavoprotein subunit beta/FixA family protein [Candidatus Dormibacteraeota bacterium]|nr:electron transfer flavoprotein subunit beta/FixA family protein [Candidatus Dormibacteraeota bacterium]